MPAIDEAIERYSHLRMGGLAESTWKAHRNELTRFRRWVLAKVGHETDLAAIDAEIVAAYMDPRRPPVLCASSFNNYLQYLRLFFDHCRQEGWITRDPLRYVRSERITRHVRRHLTSSQVKEILRRCRPRDRYAIALGFNTGLRASDLARLTVGDLDREAGFLSAWIRKTRTEVRLPITLDLEEETERWFAVYGAATGMHDGLPGYWLLVPSMHCQAVDMRRLELGTVTVFRPERPLGHPERIVHRGLRTLELPTHQEGFHTLRRSAARRMHTLALSGGEQSPIRIVQSFLGHQGQATTERYLGLEPEHAARDRLLRGRRFGCG